MLGAWLAATILAVFVRGGLNPNAKGGATGEVMRQNLWILWHVFGAIASGVALWLATSRVPRIATTIGVMIAGVASLWLFVLWADRAWAVVAINDNEPAFADVGSFARTRLPPDVVLLLEEREKLERNTLMFRARRTTYPATEANWRALARQIVDNGGVPFVVSHRELPLRPILRSRTDGRTLYQVLPADLGLHSTTTTTTVPAPELPPLNNPAPGD